MFMDKVKNFCDHSMTMWEMTDILLTSGSFWTPPASFRVKRELDFCNSYLSLLYFCLIQSMSSYCTLVYFTLICIKNCLIFFQNFPFCYFFLVFHQFSTSVINCIPTLELFITLFTTVFLSIYWCLKYQVNSHDFYGTLNANHCYNLCKR